MKTSRKNKKAPLEPPQNGHDTGASNRRDWHLHTTDQVMEALQTSSEGLDSTEANKRLDESGPNRLKERQGTSVWKTLFSQFHNPLIYVLLGTAVATGLLQHWVDTGVIVGVVIINAVIGFIQESKAEQAIRSLRDFLSPTALVMREGKKVSLPASELVPGDIVFLQSGDKVPADLRIVRSKNLQIDEAALTGESLPVEKSSDPLAGETALGDRTNMAFSSTLVTTGTATGVVVETGDTMQIGQIATMLGDVEEIDTPLIRRLTHFSKIITFFIVAFCAIFFGIGVVGGQSVMEMLMAAVALAVSAIPEGLPAVMTVALSIGVKRMAGRNAIVRKLPAVEALGSTTVICSDKTGTLTKNEMTVTQIESVDGTFFVTGTGYVPTGNILDENNEQITVDTEKGLERLILGGVLCNDASLRQEDSQWKIAGDPTEGSLIVLGRKAGIQFDEAARSWPRTDEIPFESDLQYMATLHHNHAGHAMIYMKGSPEAVLARCDKKWNNDADLDTTKWQALANSLASKGLRVLAIAEKRHAQNVTVLNSKDTDRGFELLGLVGMMDPPRPEAIEAVEKCHQAGIRVKMITGDHVSTAKAIGKLVGINDETGAIGGSELDKLNDADFDEAVSRTNIFARVSPAQKLRFVQSLQRQGHIVAMTGDGVNDAPALKQADIGVAMGVAGTEVAKEAAEMVLLDDNFASIERAVEEGRTVFNNLKKTILFILPTNGGECLTLVAAMLLGTILPILPLHILWINLVTTVALAVTLAFDPIEADVMNRPPRDPKAALIDRFLVWRTIYVSALMALGTFGLFFYELQLDSSVEASRTVAVNAIVFFEVAYLFNSRHLTETILNKEGFCGNKIVLLGVATVVALQMIFTYWPVAHTLLDVRPMETQAWLRILAASAALLLLVEVEKAVSRRSKKAHRMK